MGNDSACVGVGLGLGVGFRVGLGVGFRVGLGARVGAEEWKECSVGRGRIRPEGKGGEWRNAALGGEGVGLKVSVGAGKQCGMLQRESGCRVQSLDGKSTSLRKYIFMKSLCFYIHDHKYH